MMYRFHEYLLNTETRTLQRGGEHVEMTPKVYRTLLTLVQNHTRVMTKDELCEQIWPGQIVEDANLAQNVSSVRRLLQEPQTGRKFVGTFHGVGYRFVAKVEVSEPRLESLAKEPVKAEPRPEPKNESRPPRSRRWMYLTAGVLVLLVTLIVLFPQIRKRGEVRLAAAPDAPAVSVSTMTQLDGSQYEPAISPDGQQVAFLNIGPNGERSSLYIQRRGDLHPRQVLRGNSEYLSPSWSPDGKTLAVLEQHPGSLDLLLVPADGSTPRRLAQLSPHRYGLEFRHLDWSPNGKTIAVDDKTNEADPLTVFLISTVTQDRTRLTFPAMDIIGDLAPRFSPDGLRVAFVRLKYRGDADVYQVPVSGGEATRVTSKSMPFSDAGWRSNSEIIFTANLDGRFRFYSAHADGTESPTIAFRGADSETPIQFSNIGNSVAYSAYAPNLNIWSVTLPGDRKSTPKWSPVIATPADDIGPQISPDGKLLAFRSGYGGYEHLWVSKPDGTDAHMLAAAGLGPLLTAWDIDSQSILFTNKKADGIYRISARNPTSLTRVVGPGLSHPFPSIDGKSIFGRKGLIVMQYTLATGELHTVTDRGGSPMAQSPDGKYLYFSHGRMDTSVTRVELATSKETRVLNDLAPGYREAWALTAEGIYYLAGDHEKTSLKFKPFRAGSARDVAPFMGNLPPVGASGLSVDAAGKTMYVVRGEPIASNLKTFTVH